MKKLYSPWRNNYVKNNARQTDREKKKNDCVFCTNFAEQDDRKHYILKRFTHTVMILNLYPYNAGHLLILPHEHLADLSLLSAEARKELMNVTTLGVELLKKSQKPHGFNLGVNLGAAAGAGIPSHLHLHILPRWNDDTNFLPLLADTKTVCCDLNVVYDDLLSALTTMDIDQYLT